ncbi:amidohydrolase family protein, partial [Gemmatimonas sp.]
MPAFSRSRSHAARAAVALLAALAACSSSARDASVAPEADLVLLNGRVYTLTWPEPGRDGRPNAAAPFDSATGWRHDATAVAVQEGRIIYVGSDSGARAIAAASAQVVDLGGQTLLPGLVDAHTHVAELGQSLDRVNLTGVATEEEAVARIASRAAVTPKGEWILGYGWDEGAWANRYPDKRLLSARVPDHPV